MRESERVPTDDAVRDWLSDGPRRCTRDEAMKALLSERAMVRALLDAKEHWDEDQDKAAEIVLEQAMSALVERSRQW